MISGEWNHEAQVSRWRWTGRIAAAHALMLGEVGLFDEDGVAAILRAVDRTAGGQAPDERRVRLVARFDERIDALSAAGSLGAARVGRGMPEVLATLVRVTIRDDLRSALESLSTLRETALAFAGQHLVTLMPAHIDGQVAQPTTLGHLTGAFAAVLAPSVRAGGIRAGGGEPSPMGSGALASTGMPIDRERIAALLGFDGPVANTYDALAATDHLTETADALAAAVVPIRRFAGELLELDPGRAVDFPIAGCHLGADP